MAKKQPNRYESLIADVFTSKFKKGSDEVPFSKTELEDAAKRLKVILPKNVPDVLYSFRYRNELPLPIRKTAKAGFEWIIRGAGKGKYKFSLVRKLAFRPTENFAETKVLDSTPGVIVKYAFDDEQALLAKVRFNRLVDLFTGLVCYSLQNHLRTSVKEIGQVETDEIYVGVDKRGVHYILPVQAKGGNDKLGQVQIEQDFALCAEKFPDLICKPIAAQFLPNGVIVLFEMELSNDTISIVQEKHYKLVPPNELTTEELEIYKTRSV